ncbi:inverse autotransporter beta domain-containing protein [Xenorhabdus bovienii]|uniref:Inverse autotransporter beta domain-containing protein n=1 Tax=Xenorhabdus bovienii TaxID=40576 RepID=A0AAJ1J3V1_XENBV|nr:inverse autotransporter beta domain-containing protein [Xenorhabdus bovienii]MDE1476984.1 inverse autotransporter beta domain-containing protein [Xenorhabdus bovienii]MDE9508735.1 inverse autotransporter beta domain-containing protein [Xenorhabdus bovienii]MDE9520370.1 inverse autotransporter beta domain-containing protein [Xenorhabdus bovienii]
MHRKFDKSWPQNQPPLLKRMAWVNIIVQLAFPVAGAFTPIIAAAKTHTTSHDQQLTALPTKPYILKSGETIDLIAKRYSLTVDDIKKINQFRTFSKPFSTLGIGDEIDVPRLRLNKFLPFNYSPLDESDSKDGTNSRLSNAAIRVGDVLKSNHISNSAKIQLNGLAVSEVNQQIQNWLGHYGTARVQANISDRGRLDGSQLDMLLPLYDTKSQLTFTQFGLRRLDKRNTVNLGVGQRRFFDGGMLGYNAFFDHDFTGENTRWGIGAEYARNYLKLGANGYFRLSNWKESHLLTDYDERPANGFDLRVQGYVPALPQLGGKLMYEHYFGNEVGLINQNHRQKDPSAFTVGINYTPIPLLTFGIDRKQSTSGGGETQFNMELNYEIGTPWEKQIDPDATDFKRTLQGSRYDLVDRNNQIVLEYRKREIIRLTMDSLITGHAGDIKPLHLTVDSKYGLKNIQWEAVNLFADGGEIERQGGSHYLLTLPEYHHQGNNTYILSAVAYDEYGNASQRVETQVQVLPAAVRDNKSTFTAKNNELLADDRSTTMLKLTLEDKEGKPIRDVAGDIKWVTNQLSGEGSEPTIGKIKETQSGVYEAILTAGKKIGILKITPEVDGVHIKPLKITFVHPDAPFIKNLTIVGKLEIGQKLSATYTFNPNGGEKVDKSRYVWGDKGNIDITNGHTIVESGKLPNYALELSDAGRVKAVAVQAQNGLGLIGNTMIVNTSMSQESGNRTHGGSEGGKVRGIADDIAATVNTDNTKKSNAITLTVKTFKHGQPVRNVAVEVQATQAINRQNKPQTITVLIGGKPALYQGVTDEQGVLSIPVTDPNGLGVKTSLKITAYGSAKPKTQDVIFTVPTSPDTPLANFWGHMSESVMGANGAIFMRPQLQVELKGNMKGMATFFESGEIWPRRVYRGAKWYCGKIHANLPTQEDLQSLYRAYSANEMHDLHGWPQHRSYRSSTPAEGNKVHIAVNIDNGIAHPIEDNIVSDYVICRQQNN